MQTGSIYLIQQMIEMQVAEQLREAETRRLIRQMGGRQPIWLVCAACWLLRRVGRTLVSLGRWLEQSAARRSQALDPAQPRCLE